MAIDGIGFAGKVITKKADGDLSLTQYHLVKLTATAGGGCTTSGAGERALGAQLNKPSALGRQCSIGVLGIFPVFCDGTTAIAAGDPIKSDASGHGVKAATDKDKVIGFALEPLASGTAAIDVLVIPHTVDV